jgi:hypothetical protein
MPPVSEAPTDPVTAEDTLYRAVVDEYTGLRRAGAGIVAAAAISAAHLMFVQRANDD